MTIEEKIKEIQKLIEEKRKEKKCSKCDRDEMIYQWEQEIKRLKKMKNGK